MAFKDDYCSLDEKFGDDEIDVAEILADLPRLIAVSEYGSRIPYSWGGKRKRSAGANLGPRRAVHSPPPSVSPILSAPVGPAISTSPPAAASSEPEELITVKAEPVTSPTTPLSFAPSESDERPKRSKKKVSTKKKTEDLLKIISQINESNELLRGEIQKVRQYYDQLKARNSLLKARKQELSMGVIKREDQSNLLQMNLGQGTLKWPLVADSDQAHVPLFRPGIPVYQHQHQHQQQQQHFIMDRNANNQEMGYNYPNPYGQRVSLYPSTTTSASDNMGPRSILDHDLNMGKPVWKDSKQLVDDKSGVVKMGMADNKVFTVERVNKAIAAQARQNRRMVIICKKKGSSNSCSKLRFRLR